ncbi:GtrA family protein [bacterium]|nr:GtrA family protein [bacterium]
MSAREILLSAVTLYRELDTSHPATVRLVRFILSGGLATAVNLGTLFVLTHFFDIWYLYSSIAAFAVSFFVSFSLQKFWTFAENSRTHLHIQATLYLLVMILTLILNTTIIYTLVEHANIHYLIGQLVSGICIAIINFFSYKHLVFKSRTAKSDVEPLKLIHLLMIAGAVVALLLLSFYRLQENPPTWLDEGSIVQVSQNLIDHDVYGIQIAPGEFISTDFLTTSIPVIYPIALSFALFGTDLLIARCVMVAFIILLGWCIFALVRSIAPERGYTTPILSLLLLVTFAPLYGHGKNVLGEVPGLMFFAASLLAFIRAERSGRVPVWVGAGILAGLSMATKPIYLLIIAPSAFLIFLIRRKSLSFNAACAYALGALAVVCAWFVIHLGGDVHALREILFAANADGSTPFQRLPLIFVQFFTELQPMYFLGLLGIWILSLMARWKRGIRVESIEFFAVTFAMVNLGLYLMSRGFYRYFFPAEVLALVFLPLALATISTPPQRRTITRVGSGVCIAALILFQAHQTVFNSWISEYRNSTRSAELTEHLRNIPEGKSVFFYNVPEAVIFFESSEYYQYLRYGDNVIRGEKNLALLFSGTPDFVLVDQKFEETERLTGLYTQVDRFDKYILYEKKSENISSR